VTITHPFHPLRNQKFFMLRTRKVSGNTILTLKGDIQGTFAVPEEWTDYLKGGSEHYGSQSHIPGSAFLCIHRLLELTQLIDQLNHKRLYT